MKEGKKIDVSKDKKGTFWSPVPDDVKKDLGLILKGLIKKQYEDGEALKH